MHGAADEAAARGYRVVRIDAPIVGEARTAATAYRHSALERASRDQRPVCVISSGETTVHVTGRGKGGRNQEFALAYGNPSPVRYGNPSPVPPENARESRCSDSGQVQDPSPWVLASAGTDGIDGPTDAAGAIVDSETLTRARAAGLDPNALLANNDAYAFFDALGDLIRTGPTGTNVGDLQVLLLA